MNYGVPYQGSKRSIAKEILEHLPKGKRLVDLFGGGGAITHYAIHNYSSKWDNFLYNDINTLVTNLFQNSVEGRYSNDFEPSWVSPVEFDNYKDMDGFIKYIWSYGNTGDGYLYSKDNYDIKKHVYKFILTGDAASLNYLEDYYKDSYYWLLKGIHNPDDNYTGNRLRFRDLIVKLEAVRVCRELGGTEVYDCFKDYSLDEFLKVSQNLLTRVIDFLYPNIPLKAKQKPKNHLSLSMEEFNNIPYLKDNYEYYDVTPHLPRLGALKGFDTTVFMTEIFNRVERLNDLTELNTSNLEITNNDYKDYTYQDGDVVYCDIPYKNTNNNYDNDFNHDEFYNWCSEQEFPVFVSEYSSNIMGEVLWCKNHRAFKTNTKRRVETLQRI